MTLKRKKSSTYHGTCPWGSSEWLRSSPPAPGSTKKKQKYFSSITEISPFKPTMIEFWNIKKYILYNSTSINKLPSTVSRYVTLFYHPKKENSSQTVDRGPKRPRPPQRPQASEASILFFSAGSCRSLGRGEALYWWSLRDCNQEKEKRVD